MIATWPDEGSEKMSKKRGLGNSSKMPTLVVGVCADPRVPYRGFVQELNGMESMAAVMLPLPGADFGADSRFVPWYIDHYGQTPFLMMPHQDCLAWHGRGGYEANLETASELIGAMLGAEVPTSLIPIQNDGRYGFCQDGFSSVGHHGLWGEVINVVRCHDWSYRSDVNVNAVAFGRDFTRMQHEKTVRFSAQLAMRTESAFRRVCTVINHFGGGRRERLSVHFSAEVRSEVRSTILRALSARSLPVNLMTASVI